MGFFLVRYILQTPTNIFCIWCFIVMSKIVEIFYLVKVTSGGFPLTQSLAIGERVKYFQFTKLNISAIFNVTMKQRIQKMFVMVQRIHWIKKKKDFVFPLPVFYAFMKKHQNAFYGNTVKDISLILCRIILGCKFSFLSPTEKP